ncbi:MAG TPA: WecB/TagA/CpsF family glycosyltransferase [Oligoflexus sp.]|uniref:WecB/TagA/CpsF family glycosyltransferase n=1 Tax=Oligoflexus sp. TaxID=1971216 RepID=UPI002D5E31FA|nr:WecB/TagA/CpsF family glycosyltransferase [Oligoflexus sp.]HYX33248.1 WecB/TagA/CpsF family glycosyltransferase [Oligoflexus sp.]
MSERLRLGYANIDVVSLQEALQRAVTFAKQSPCRFVVTPNSDHIVQLETRLDLRRVYNTAHLVVADGMPIVWASRLLGKPLPERVTGSELMPQLCAEAARLGLRVYLLGGPPGVAELAKAKLEERYPGLQVCGCDCPPFGFEHKPDQEARILQKIQAAAPDIVFVALGAPKQELWMARTAPQLKSGILLGIGAALEFCAGTVTRAPLWMQRIGAEWIYRMCQEPRRLVGRYLRDTQILLIIFREWRKR